MTQNITTPDADEIDSTFQTVNDDEKPTPDYATEVAQGIHVYDKYAVTRTYTVERFPRDDVEDRLSVYTRRDIDCEEVDSSEEMWELDGDTVVHSGESILEFAESNHFADPQLDIEVVMQDE